MGKKLKVKYLAGWLRAESMEKLSTWLGWTARATEAEKNEKSLMVFEIPKARETEIVTMVEKYLQANER